MTAVVIDRRRPEKPFRAESLGFSDVVWELVQLCWSESISARPTAVQLFVDLSTVAAHTWAPPSVYPMKVSANTAHVDSSGSPVVSPMNSNVKGRAGNSVKDLVKYLLCSAIPLLIYLVILHL